MCTCQVHVEKLKRVCKMESAIYVVKFLHMPRVQHTTAARNRLFEFRVYSLASALPVLDLLRWCVPISIVSRVSTPIARFNFWIQSPQDPASSHL